eukprot:358722-Chlamydomonas_euryale.AAC.4
MEVTACLPAYQLVGRTILCTNVPILESLDRRRQRAIAGTPASFMHALFPPPILFTCFSAHFQVSTPALARRSTLRSRSNLARIVSPTKRFRLSLSVSIAICISANSANTAGEACALQAAAISAQSLPRARTDASYRLMTRSEESQAASRAWGVERRGGRACAIMANGECATGARPRALGGLRARGLLTGVRNGQRKQIIRFHEIDIVHGCDPRGWLSRSRDGLWSGVWGQVATKATSKVSHTRFCAPLGAENGDRSACLASTDQRLLSSTMERA